MDYRQILEGLGWIDKVVDCVRPYKPEIINMTINYRDRNAEIEVLLHIPDNLKRKIKTVEIPAYQNFVIYEMRDETFRKIGGLWWFEDGKWKLKPSNLPSSEKYWVTLKGKLPKDAISKIVFVQPAANKDRTEEVDRYWLSSMLRNVEIVEKIWNELNIDDVTAGVRVGIERCFSTCIPKELDEKLKVTQRWIRAGHGRDRGELWRAWRELRLTDKLLKISVEEVINTIYKLTSGDAFAEFLTMDKPYTIGDIRREETYKGPIPVMMYTEGLARLTLKQQTANGYLTFKKKNYQEAIKREFEKLS